MKADLPEHLISAWTKHLTQIVGRLRPDMAARLLLAALERKPSWNSAKALAPLAERFGPEEPSRIWLSAAESLSSDQTKTKRFDPGSSWINGMGALVIRLPPDMAARTARLLAGVAESRGGRAYDFYNLLTSLDSDDAARVARVLVAAIGQEKDPKIGWWLAAALCLVAEKMDPAEAARVCGPAVVEMGKAVATRKSSESSEYNGYLIGGFVTVASRQSSTVAGRCARVLADALVEATNGYVRMQMAEGLATLASRMDQRRCPVSCHTPAGCNVTFALCAWPRRQPDWEPARCWPARRSRPSPGLAG